MRARALVVLVAPFALLTGCRITGTFGCGFDDACRRGDELGVCEVDGFCSFGDSGCPSGRRYADNAGELANECVDENAEPLSCRDKWRTNVVTFGAVTDLGANSLMDDRDPWVSGPGTTLLFGSNRMGSMAVDIYSATRPDITVPFSTPALFAALNSPSSDAHVSLSADGLTVYLSSNRSGTTGGMDIWRATRTTMTGTFSAPDQATVDAVNSGDDEHDVTLSADGLTLYYARGRSAVPQRLTMAKRAAVSADFGAPSAIVELDGGGDADPAVTADELLMVFTSQRAAPILGTNLWYTTRTSVTEKWLPPRLVPDLNIDGEEGDAFLSPDACTIYFSRSLASTEPYDLVYANVIQ